MIEKVFAINGVGRNGTHFNEEKLIGHKKYSLLPRIRYSEFAINGVHCIIL